MLEEVHYCKEVVAGNLNKPMVISAEDEEAFKNADSCWICKEKYTKEDVRVIDHCHITGKFLGSAHNKCNLDYHLTDKIPVVFHNLRGYDFHFIMQNIGEIVKKHKYYHKKWRTGGDEDWGHSQ